MNAWLTSDGFVVLRMLVAAVRLFISTRGRPVGLAVVVPVLAKKLTWAGGKLVVFTCQPPVTESAPTVVVPQLAVGLECTGMIQTLPAVTSARTCVLWPRPNTAKPIRTAANA